jgi:lactate dehydrogenase-like 2-hydroxyacid dehydrogenase
MEYSFHHPYLLQQQKVPLNSRGFRNIILKSGLRNKMSSFAILIADVVGTLYDEDDEPDCRLVQEYVMSEYHGAVWHKGSNDGSGDTSGLHFYYDPSITPVQIEKDSRRGLYDAIIVAAKLVPKNALFPWGGCRIGAGTGNMQCLSWGGPDGGGDAPLMNTPGVNSRATAHMVMKSLLRCTPDIDVTTLHALSAAKSFDTLRDLRGYGTTKLEGKIIAVLGYGNIGREVALLSRAFGMRVRVYARSRHRKWIESEGFEFAESPVAAATGAGVISPHTGLGPANCNVGLVGNSVLSVLARGAVLINMDRGEVVNGAALGAAMEGGMVRFVAVDADVFVDTATGFASGPLVPYIELQEKYPSQVELLPHVAADTDHITRVNGAKQAINQLVDYARLGVVTNGKGTPPTSTSRQIQAVRRVVSGVGPVDSSTIHKFVEDSSSLAAVVEQSKRMAESWASIAAAKDPIERARVAQSISEDLLLSINIYSTLLRQGGLHGPFYP